MTATSRKDFLTCLKASQILDADQLQEIVAQVGPDDPKAIARRLIHDGLITRWQAKYLLNGRHILHVGNYKLLERIGKSNLGDRFLAVHTQLDRLVNLQILPSSLQANQSVKDNFILKASRASTIDHPNLIHVYDIDEEGKRFYLVVEHFDGKPLSDYPVEQLTEFDVARIMQQAALGLEEAHRKELVHGQVNDENIIVTNNDVVKIRNLVVASIDNLNVQTTPSDDLNGLGQVGVNLLNRVKGPASQESRKQLFDVLSALSVTDGSGYSGIRKKLDAWISANDESAQQTIKSAAPVVNTRTTARANPKPESTSSQLTRRQQLELAQQQKQAAANPVSAQKNPAKMMALLAVAGLVAIAAVTAIVVMLNSPGDATAKQQTKPVSNDRQKTGITKPIQATPNQPVDPPSTIDQTKTGNDGSPLESDDQLPANEELQEMLTNRGKAPEGTQPQESQPQEPQPQEPQPDPEKGAEPAAKDQANGKVIELTADPSNAEKPPGEDSSGEPMDNAGSGNTAAEESGDDPAANRDESKPFAGFPKKVDLPAVENVQATKLGDVHMNKNYLMVAELLTGREICKTRIGFELERDEQDKQKWTVNLIRRKSDPPIPVAAFRKEGDAISFQWLPAAAENEYAQYLRNCTLKMTAIDQIGFVSLRKPMDIEGLMVNEENRFDARIESELAWLPDPESIKVELQPVNYENFKGTLANREVTRKQPGIIFLSDKNSQKFIWLQVKSDVRRKLKLSASLQFAAPNSRPTVARMKDISALTTMMKNFANESSARYEQIKDAAKPPNTSWDDFNKAKKDIKSQSDAAQSAAADAIELESMLPNVINKQIPLIVYFEMDGIRTELARSHPN